MVLPRLSCHGGCSLTENSGSALPASPGAAGFRQDGLRAAVAPWFLLICHAREALWGRAVLAGRSVCVCLCVAGSRLDASRSRRDFLPLCYLRPLQLTAIGTERTKGGRQAEKPPSLSALVAGVSSAEAAPRGAMGGGSASPSLVMDAALSKHSFPSGWRPRIPAWRCGRHCCPQQQPCVTGGGCSG